MDIKNINSYTTQSMHNVQDQRQLRGDEKTSSKEASTAVDRVQLSKESQSMTQLNKVVMERSEVRAERVDQLRNLVENNLYTIDPKGLAKKMMDEVF